MKLNISYARCISQVALLGNVTQNIRAVIMEWDESNIKLLFYYDRKPTDEEEDLAEQVATEIISDCTEYMIEVEKWILPFPAKVPYKEKQLFIYHRYEPLPAAEAL